MMVRTTNIRSWSALFSSTTLKGGKARFATGFRYSGSDDSEYGMLMVIPCRDGCERASPPWGSQFQYRKEVKRMEENRSAKPLPHAKGGFRNNDCADCAKMAPYSCTKLQMTRRGCNFLDA